MQRKQGIVSAHPDGFGFITELDGARHFVGKRDMKAVIPADIVSFTVMSDARSGKQSAVDLKLIDRPETFWLGELKQGFDGFEFVADDPIHVKFSLPNDHRMVPDQVYVVRVAPNEVANTAVPVSVVECIGSRNKKGFDVDYAIAKWRIPSIWPDAVLIEANALQQQDPARITDAVDLTDLPFVTIDGEGTRDYDDAVYACRFDDGVVLKVAIADVSRYVKVGTALDDEACRRGTSVYFPGRVVAMLPEAISNDLCSLNPHTIRAAVVCSMVFDPEGHLISHAFDRSIIKSQARLTYNVVAEHVNGINVLPFEIGSSIDAIKTFYDFMAPQRAARGLQFERSREPKVHHRAGEGESADLYDVTWEDLTIAHGLVEECMLAANTCAAATMHARQAKALYRHHKGMDPQKWDAVRTTLSAYGIDAPTQPSLVWLQSTLASLSTHPKYPVIEWAVRKSFDSAIYDPVLPSHFSLNTDFYAHFTSPIRRYPDLEVHRILLGEITYPCGDISHEFTVLSRRANQASGFPWNRIKKRALARDTSTAHPSRVEKIVSKGIGVRIEGWNCKAFIPADFLKSAGYTLDEDLRQWRSPAGNFLDEGEEVAITIAGITDIASKCEVVASIHGIEKLAA